MITETKHSPLPFKVVQTAVKSCPLIVAGDGVHSGFSIQLHNQADAAFICRACNSQEELLEACKQALFAVPTIHGAFPTISNAIAKAESGQ